MTAWKRNIEEILAASRGVGVSLTEGGCRCPDEAHQNLLHDIAVDLPAALAADRTEQQAAALELAADECDDWMTELVLASTFAEARDVLKGYLHGMAARARGDQS